MPITLVQVAEEIAQAAAAVDVYLDEKYRKRVLADFDELGIPVTEIVSIAGREIEVPRAALRDQSRLEAEEIAISIDSDVVLESRVTQKRTDPVSIITATARRRPQWRGVYLPDSQGSFSDQLTFKGTAIPLIGFRYFTQQAKLSISVEEGYNLLPLIDSTFTITYKDESCEVGAGTPYGFTCNDNVLLADFPWDPVGFDIFNSMVNGDKFTIGFSHPENTLEGIIVEDAPKHYDIMVALKLGLDPTDSHLSLKCRFLRRPAAEGAARITDNLNQSMGV